MGSMAARIVTMMTLVLAGVLSAAVPAGAQYFGQNKVQHQRFDFLVLSTEHFDIHYYAEEADAVQLAARMAERWYARLSAVLQHDLTGRQPLILYAAHPHFRQTNVVSGEIGEGTGGVTEIFKRRIVLPFAGGLAETDHVLGHELVHAFQFDMARRRDAGNAISYPALLQLPLWFIEGMAEYLSLGPVDAHTAMWVRDASFRERMPAVRRLDDPRYFPYRYGHAFWAYVAGRWGDAAVGDMLRAAGARGSAEAAMRSVLGVDAETFTRDWHEATRATYAPFLETTRIADAFGRALITRAGSGGTLNVGPALSPDGRRLVFLSERSLFSIDMYLADADTGRVIRRLVSTAGDPHFDSLQFLASAGSWAPDNQRIVFAALRRGRPVLAIVNVDTGRTEHERSVPELGEIFTPAWSPDGRQVVFSALTGGLLDLHLYDIGTDTVQQLTRDAFAEMHPAWSPDGREIAFVTDRFTSTLDSLAFGEYRLAILHVATGEIRPVHGFEAGQQTRPQWSGDGRALYFVATPDGIPNVYRVAVGDARSSPPQAGAVTRVTNVRSGVSGITPLTPALSVAGAAPRLVFTVFEGDHYNIYSVDTDPAPAVPDPPEPVWSAARLPPVQRATADVEAYVADPSIGLPEPTAYEATRYRPRLSLDAIGPPAVGVGVDRFGAYAAGSVSLLFSDMLGDHTLGATVQLTSRLEEIGGVAAYLNRRSRWNWGIVGEQTPYVAGTFAQRAGVIGGQPVFVQQEYRIVQRNSAATGLVQYPSVAHNASSSRGPIATSASASGSTRASTRG
jgi:Tol biopolymer transport system component